MLPTFGGKNDGFGYSVSISGEYAVVGTTNNSAIVYKKEENSWIKQSFLIDPEIVILLVSLFQFQEIMLL